MKPIHVDWVPSRRWQVGLALWATTAVIAIIVGVWQWPGHQSALAHEHEQQDVLRTQMDALKQPAKPMPAADARLRQQVQAQMLLDLNPVFATIEGLQLPGVQLRSMNVDAGSGVVRVEYTLDSVAQASLVSEKLNGGYDKKPWVLTGVMVNAGSGLGGSAAVPGGVGGTSGGAVRYTGVWVVGIVRM